jgi:hypothetical protein
MFRWIAVVAASLTVPPLALAHHGFGTFDRTQEIEIRGVITRVDFVNPHAWVYVDVTGSDGRVTPYRCEMRAASVLRRSGWSADMFVAGEPITINGAPDREDPNSCYLSTAVFADGTRADRYGQLRAAEPVMRPEDRPARLPSGEPNISGDWATEQLVMADLTGRGGDLVPLSLVEQFEDAEVIPDSEWVGARTDVSPGSDEPVNFRQYRTRPVELTEAGQRAADEYGMFTRNDPRMRCETTSILFDWVYDGAINRITQEPGRIIMQYGQFGFTRTIHMDRDSHPSDITPSRGGHSIGRWEGDVLVVDTIGFAPGVLSPPVMHSDQLHIVERISLNPETLELRREYVATDPVNWVGEYRGTDVILPADLPYSPDPCEPELTFTNFSEQVQQQAGATTAPVQPQARPWWRFWAN